MVSIDFRKMKVSAGSLVVLTGDLPFIPIEMSRDFHACYISVPEELADEMFYKVASSFWDLLYRYPVLPTTPEQNRLLKHWFIQTDWVINHFTIGEFYQFNLSSCIRQQNSLTAQFVSFSLANLANIFYPPDFYNN